MYKQIRRKCQDVRVLIETYWNVNDNQTHLVVSGDAY